MASSKEIEREVETQRASVESTLDALKEKMSFGQMVDEFGGYVGTEDAKAALGNIGRQVRENPIALGLVGVGLAWLMIGGRERSGADYDREWDRAWDDDQRYAGPGEGSGFRNVGRATPGAAGGRSYGSAYGSPYRSEERGDGGSNDGVVSRAGRAVSDTAHAVGDRLSQAGETVTDAVSDVGERLRASRDDGRRRMRAMGDEMGSHMPSAHGLSERGRRAAGDLADTFERQPLLAGAFAVAAGVAIGAALPATRAEDRWLGGRRDDMLDSAKDAAMGMRDQAVDAAKAGLRAASDAADEEGLMPERDGKTMAAKVESVVKAGVEETRRNLDPDRTAESAGAKA